MTMPADDFDALRGELTQLIAQGFEAGYQQGVENAQQDGELRKQALQHAVTHATRMGFGTDGLVDAAGKFLNFLLTPAECECDEYAAECEDEELFGAFSDGWDAALSRLSHIHSVLDAPSEIGDDGDQCTGAELRVAFSAKATEHLLGMLAFITVNHIGDIPDVARELMILLEESLASKETSDNSN